MATAIPFFSITFFIFFANPSFFFLPVISTLESDDAFTVSDFGMSLFHQDYSPPAPPPPPPHPPSVSCEEDLGGVGSLDTTCKIVSSVNITRNLYIAGKDNFYILSNVSVSCFVLGCEIAINVTGNFSLGEDSEVVVGKFDLTADNATFCNGSRVNTTAMGGTPPAKTNGTPQGVDGAGGGHGGRGACCLIDKKKVPEDVWWTWLLICHTRWHYLTDYSLRPSKVKEN